MAHDGLDRPEIADFLTLVAPEAVPEQKRHLTINVYRYSRCGQNKANFLCVLFVPFL